MMCVCTDGKRRDYNGTFPPGAAGVCLANGKNRFQAACCPRLPPAAPSTGSLKGESSLKNVWFFSGCPLFFPALSARKPVRGD
jgi:hypothetical protein